jgi:hypothetical protein
MTLSVVVPHTIGMEGGDNYCCNFDLAKNEKFHMLKDFFIFQWHGIQDNQLRVAIATQIASYCTSTLVTCGVTRYCIRIHV